MPLFDFFKKKPQQKSVKASQKDGSIFTSKMQKKHYDMAMEFIDNFQERMPLINGKPHAGTVLAVAARLAGTSLYRSLN